MALLCIPKMIIYVSKRLRCCLEHIVKGTEAKVFKTISPLDEFDFVYFRINHLSQASIFRWYLLDLLPRSIGCVLLFQTS